MPDQSVDIWCSVVAFHTPAEEIAKLALALSKTTSSVSLTIIDNSSSLPTIPAPDGLRLTILTPSKNLGYGRAHNLAIEQSRGLCRYHLVMNSDIDFEPTVIDELVRFMDSRHGAGLVMPMVKYPDGQIQHLCRLLPNPITLIGRRMFGNTSWAKNLDRQYELHDWDHGSIAEFPFLSGCFMFMRRDVLDVVGGFDPRYFLYAEDLDLSRRLHSVSETLFYPFATITHEYRSKQRRSIRQWLYAFRSLAQYFTKWGWVVDAERERVNSETITRLANASSEATLQASSDPP